MAGRIIQLESCRVQSEYLESDLVALGQGVLSDKLDNLHQVLLRLGGVSHVSTHWSHWLGIGAIRLVDFPPRLTNLPGQCRGSEICGGGVRVSRCQAGRSPSGLPPPGGVHSPPDPTPPCGRGTHSPTPLGP